MMTLVSENKIINAIFFQLIWWGTVLFKGYIIVPTLILVLLHILGLKKNKKKELIFITFFTATGFMVDSLLTNFGVLGFLPEHMLYIFGIQIIPTWLITLWLAFACTVNHSLKWAFKNPILSIFIGLFAGPSSYIAANKFNALDVLPPIQSSSLILAVIWSLLFLLTSFVTKKFYSN